MNHTLIATLLNCPNLSLRVLDQYGRAIKTLSQEQLLRYFSDTHQSCARDCDNPVCLNHMDHLE